MNNKASSGAREEFNSTQQVFTKYAFLYLKFNNSFGITGSSFLIK